MLQIHRDFHSPLNLGKPSNSTKRFIHSHIHRLLLLGVLIFAHPLSKQPKRAIECQLRSPPHINLPHVAKHMSKGTNQVLNHLPFIPIPRLDKIDIPRSPPLPPIIQSTKHVSSPLPSLQHKANPTKNKSNHP